MRKYHSQRIYDKLLKFADFINDRMLDREHLIWTKRLRKVENAMNSLYDCVGMSCDDWERIHEQCSPGMMLEFNTWWKEARLEVSILDK